MENLLAAIDTLTSYYENTDGLDWDVLDLLIGDLIKAREAILNDN